MPQNLAGEQTGHTIALFHRVMRTDRASLLQPAKPAIMFLMIDANRLISPGIIGLGNLYGSSTLC